MTGLLQQTYQDRIAAGVLEDDSGQRAALAALTDLEAKLEEPAGRGGFFGFRKDPQRIPNIYLWGGVGRGKTMLMDMFFDSSKTENKMRSHFLEFMQDVHAEMNVARKQGVSDAILPVAAAISEKARLLCLDECQIDDIADAMIVGRLFETIIARGTVVVTTSNRPPQDLYRDGINRHLFLPFIELIREKFDIHEIGSGTDHRQNRLAGEIKYFVPPAGENALKIDEIWQGLLSGGVSHSHTLTVNNRKVILNHYCNGVARAAFWDLCGQPYGPADFLAISQAVRVLLLENIPLLSRSNYNEARRFVMLIDALYERRVQLIASAAAQPEKLYVEGVGSFEFERTASRLYEMQSCGWGL